MIIDGIEYVKANEAKPSTKQIIVAQRGWVIVGDVSEEGEYLHINNCSVIRNWGTTNGLGEIASGGPTSKTKLDSCPMVTVHKLSTVLQMNVDESKWT